MSIVKSYSVGNGDMYIIQHNTDNFTTIDCCYSDDKNREEIYKEIEFLMKGKSISRFISTHPDDDHIRGLKFYNDKFGIVNFYCVENKATKTDETDDFKIYCKLRDDAKIPFYLYKGCKRKWMNEESDERKSSGINIKWPELDNPDFKSELENASKGLSPNNICPIIEYSMENSGKFLWFGDLETTYLEKIDKSVKYGNPDVIFAPHHGRKSGRIPSEILKKINPKIIVIGEAPSEDIEYYKDYKRILQNSAKDITFNLVSGYIHIYVSSESYTVDFLENLKLKDDYGRYIGSLKV